MSQRQKKSNFSAQKGGLSVQELKQMTAKRMGVGPPRPQAQPNQSMNSTFPSASSQHTRLLDPAETPHSALHFETHPSTHSIQSSGSSTNPLAHTTPIKLPSQHAPVPVSNGTHLNTVAAPVDKGLSVQELKALTRMRLAREAGSSHGPESHPKPMNTSVNPSTNDGRDGFHRAGSPPMDGMEFILRTSKKCVEDYMGAILHDVPSHQKPLPHSTMGHTPRSSSTSPTVESSSTGSESDYVMQSYNAKKYTSSRQFPPAGTVNPSYPAMPNKSDSYENDRAGPRRSRSNSLSSTERANYLDPFSVTSSSDFEPSLDRDHAGRERYHPDRYVNGSRRLEPSHHDRAYVENSAIDRKLQEYFRHDRQREAHADQEYFTNQNRIRSRHDYLPQHHEHMDHNRDPREHRDRQYDPQDHKRYQNGHHDQQESSSGVPNAVLHAKLLNLEQQQLERELRERDLREQHEVKYRHQRELQLRELQLREQHMRDQRRREQLLHAQQEREQQHREQQHREQQQREHRQREQQMREQQMREQQMREQLMREQHRRENAEREQQHKLRQEREEQQREQRHRERERLEEREFRDKRDVQTSRDEVVPPLTLEIPGSEDDSDSLPVRQEQRTMEGQQPQQLPQTSSKPLVAPLYEGNLRKMVMTKSVASNSGSVSGYDVTVSPTSDTLDTSLLPSGSPFRPTVVSVPDQSIVLPELQPSPPDSPRSMRHGSKRQLAVNCPAPVRMRSSSDINDLAFSVAESVLYSPTARSPANSLHKTMASSPSSASSSMDSPRGSFSAPSITSVSNSVNNSINNGGSGSVASGGGASVLDADLLMNQFSLDSNDEYTHSMVDMANSITEF